MGAGGWGVVTEFPAPPNALDYWAGIVYFVIAPQPPARDPYYSYVY
jgi:hypothetical protein